MKNDQFREIQALRGVRAYNRSDLARIIPKKKPLLVRLKILFRLADMLINFFALFVLGRHKCHKGQYSIHEVAGIDSGLQDYISRRMKSCSKIQRNSAEFSWLKDYPWVVTEVEDTGELSKYYFSQASPDFKQWMLRISDAGETIRGFVLLTLHRHELKTPYLLAEPEVLEDLFCYIINLMSRERIPTLVTQSESFAALVQKKRKYFLHIRRSVFGFMATPELIKLTGGDFGQLFEGDGDGMFT